MKKIVINPFDADSINNAIKEFEELKQRYRELEKQVCYEVALIGAEVAQEIYDEWSKSWDNKSVVVEAIKTETGASLLANGESVCFLEFGSGATANGKTIEGYTFTPASWSASELGSGKYATMGFWYFNKEKYTYIPAANAMDKAIAIMRERSKEVAERVMKGATI